jgi:hypothetical protein
MTGAIERGVSTSEKWACGPIARAALEGEATRKMLIATNFRSPYWAAARRPGLRSQPRQIRGSSGAPTREAAGTDAKTDDGTLSGLSTVGYQVVGPEGPLGLVEALRFEHGSEVPFLLVVRDDEQLTLVSARRVTQILPKSRRLLLSPASSGLGRR